MERIDKDTWRTDNGDEVRARGLKLTVEFGEKTKAELLCAVKAVREENDKLRELVEVLINYGRKYHTMNGACPMFDADAEGDDFCGAVQAARELGIGGSK